MRAFYNEIDPYCCAWISNLMDAGHITPGVISDKSIEDILPAELSGFKRVHFFAGIAIWDHALNQAGWGTKQVWTGSTPCQPFSAAGQGLGFADERHLWPAFYHLVGECRPGVVFGEQVASRDGLAWLDLVHTDMEAAQYAFGAVDLCAAGVGAPHIRQRLFWVADAQRDHSGRQAATSDYYGAQADRSADWASRCGSASSGLADPIMQQRPHRQPGIGAEHDANGRIEGATAAAGLCSDLRPGPVNGHWRDADWLFCRDGKWRPAQPELEPLVTGYPGRVGQLRAYGNAICATAAEAFISAYMECQP